jgi:hypothetical protein
MSTPDGRQDGRGHSRHAPSGYDFALSSDAEPPAHVIGMLSHYKGEIVWALQMRQAEQRGLIAQWIDGHSVQRQQASAPIAAAERDRRTRSS